MGFHFRAFVLALQLLTRLPVPHWLDNADYKNPRLAGLSLIHYPVVGLLIGLLLVLAQWLITQLWPQTSPLLSAALLLAMWIAITGALHLDGLADSADAWLGGMGDPQRTLAIMKDPCSGPAGVTRVVAVLIIKFAALASLLEGDWLLLLIAPMLARSAVVALFLTTGYARRNGMGEQAALNAPRTAAWSAVFLTILLTVLLAGTQSHLPIVTSLVAWYLLRRRMINRIGGMTGDTAGEMIETIEVTVLVSLVLSA